MAFIRIERQAPVDDIADGCVQVEPIAVGLTPPANPAPDADPAHGNRSRALPRGRLLVIVAGCHRDRFDQSAPSLSQDAGSIVPLRVAHDWRIRQGRRAILIAGLRAGFGDRRRGLGRTFPRDVRRTGDQLRGLRIRPEKAVVVPVGERYDELGRIEAHAHLAEIVGKHRAESPERPVVRKPGFLRALREQTSGLVNPVVFVGVIRIEQSAAKARYAVDEATFRVWVNEVCPWKEPAHGAREPGAGPRRERLRSRTPRRCPWV